MSADRLIAQMLASREFWVDLGGGRRVKMRRPAETRTARGEWLDYLIEHSVAWEGFDEAFLLGPAIGGDDKPKFDRDLWRVVLEDHADFIEPMVEGLKAANEAHQKARGETAKN